LQDFLRDHPHYRLAGRTKLFTDADILRLIEALPCPSSSSRRAKARTGRSAARISGGTLTEALALASERSPPKCSKGSSGKSNVVSFAEPGEPTFASAAASYMKAGGERKYLRKLLEHFGDKPLREIDQAEIDARPARSIRTPAQLLETDRSTRRSRLLFGMPGYGPIYRRQKAAAATNKRRGSGPSKPKRSSKKRTSSTRTFAALLIVLCYTGFAAE
jgi:hypothetical protein